MTLKLQEEMDIFWLKINPDYYGKIELIWHNGTEDESVWNLDDSLNVPLSFSMFSGKMI